MMMFSLVTLFKVMVLFINAVAVLNHERFLKRVGWGFPPDPNEATSAYGNFKAKAVHILHAVHLLAPIPLIFINSLIVVFELVFG